MGIVARCARGHVAKITQAEHPWGVVRRVLVSLAASLAASACSLGEREQKPRPHAADPPAPVAPAAPERGGLGPADPPVVGAPAAEAPQIPWFDGSLDQALAQARASGRLVFVEVGAYWCPPCQRLDEETFRDPAVVALLRDGFVPIRVDVERGEGAEVAQRYHVMAYPTLLVLAAGGLEKGRIVDFVPPDVFVEQVTTLRAGGDVLAALDARAEANPDDLDLAYRAAHAHMLAADRAGAKARYDALELADPKGMLGLLPKVAFDRAAMIEKLDGDCERAAAMYQAVARRFADDPIALSARRRRARCLLRLGRADEARAVVEALLASGDDPRTLSNVAWFCFRNRVFVDLGRTAAERGIRREPEDPDFPYLAGELALRAGALEAAVRFFEQAVATSGGRSFYRRRLAEVRAGTPAAGGPG